MMRCWTMVSRSSSWWSGAEQNCTDEHEWPTDSFSTTIYHPPYSNLNTYYTLLPHCPHYRQATDSVVFACERLWVTALTVFLTRRGSEEQCLY